MKIQFTTCLLAWLLAAGGNLYAQMEPAKPYEAEWKRIDSLEAKGMTRDALAQTEALLAMAKRDGNTPQTVKALCYQMKFIAPIEEKADSLNLLRLKNELRLAQQPLHSILQSLLGEFYFSYYQQNRWRIMDRSAVDVVPDDFSTWDAATLMERAATHYLASLADAAALQGQKIEAYEAILRRGHESATYRPTLYDLLVHRALDFLTNTETSLNEPSYKFELPLAQGFLPVADFVQAAFSSRDETSRDLRAAKLLQQALAFHIGSGNVYALVDLDLRRLDFAFERAAGEGKEAAMGKALAALQERHAGHPASALVSHRIAQRLNSDAAKYNPFSGDEAHRQDYKEAYALCEKVIQKFPDSEGANLCRSLQAEIKSRSLDVVMEEALVPKQAARALLRHRNLENLYCRIIRVDEALRRRIQKSRYNDEMNLAQLLREQPVLHEWQYNLPATGDYQPHRSEISLPGLAPGSYMLIVANDAAFSIEGNGMAYTEMQVTNIAFFAQNKEDSHHIYARHRESGAPLKKLKVRMERFNYQNDKWEEQDSGVTDAEGLVVLNAQEGWWQTRLLFSDRKQKDKYQSDNYQMYGRGYSDTESRILTRFFLDRTIYRPGQTIYFKGIVLEGSRNSHEIRDNYAQTVKLMDVNGQEVAALEVTSNAYGSFSGSFTAPSSGLMGTMSIMGDNGGINFSVEEYKRPRFEVTIDTLAGSYRLGEQVTVQGKATTYAGSTVDGAEMRYRVLRQARFPWWGYFRWWMPQPESPAREIASGQGRTDAKGAFSIPFELIPDATLSKADKPVFTYTVYVDVVDISGETRSAEYQLQAGYNALLVDLKVPDELDKSALKPLGISTTNLSGKAEAASGTLTVSRLEEIDYTLRSRRWERQDLPLMSESEYRRQFPHDVFAGEDDPRNRKRTATAATLNFNTATDASIDLSALGSQPAGWYRLDLSTRDAYGEPLELSWFTQLYDSRSAAAGNEILSARLSSATAEPGQTVTLKLSSALRNLPVVYRLEFDGELLDERHIVLRGNGASLDIPIQESHRGGLHISVAAIGINEFAEKSLSIAVPWSNKQLSLSWVTLRSPLLPGAKEQWKLKVSGPDRDKASAEVLAAMYDASLEAFAPANSFSMNMFGNSSRQLLWQSAGFAATSSRFLSRDWTSSVYYQRHSYDQLENFGAMSGGHYYMQYSMKTAMAGGALRSKRMEKLDSDADGVAEFDDAGADFGAEGIAMAAPPVADSNRAGATPEPAAPAAAAGEKAPPQVRRNLQETAFFYPHLETDSEGNVLIDFTMPEALTRWRVLAFAHNAGLQTGSVEATVLTQKDLMVMPNLPRFLRQGDMISLKTKVSNLSANTLKGTATLALFDALTMQPVEAKFGLAAAAQPFSAEAGQSAAIGWQIRIPDDVQAVVLRVSAEAGNFSDGEEVILPVLTNRMLVTESLPLPIRGKESRNFTLQKLASNTSASLRHQRLTLEFTSNPAWYAVQALPYLMEYPHECSEQVFSRLYANALASHIANSQPRIRQVFELWKASAGEEGARNALMSNLEQNQELKSALLAETPWVLQANNERASKARVGLLFDLNRMSDELASAMQKLSQMQYSNGAFPWFSGMPANTYITTLIATGLGHLSKMGVGFAQDPESNDMAQRAVLFLDQEFQTNYDRIRNYQGFKPEENHLGYSEIQHLYMRSFYPDLPLADGTEKAYEYFYGQAQKFWPEAGRYGQGMIALTLQRRNGDKIAAQIVESLRQNAIRNPELGMYWKQSSSWNWYDAPIEQQALFIEAFAEVANDRAAVEEMKLWLLKNKQTNDWKTTRATVAACNALLMQGADLLARDELVAVSLGGVPVNPAQRPDTRVEAGTGYYKTAWQKDEISASMGQVSVSNPAEGAAWGALYWQYFEDLDKITYAATPLSLKKALYLEEITPEGPRLSPIEGRQLKAGDKVIVRIELRVDRDMDYVHMKDMRAAGFEPINVLSQYKYQDGLGYYESTRDAATHFFFSSLRGNRTYVFEYPLRVSHSGDFSNGITTIQCMYAPEFTSHSPGIRVQVAE